MDRHTQYKYWLLDWADQRKIKEADSLGRHRLNSFLVNQQLECTVDGKGRLVAYDDINLPLPRQPWVSILIAP
jgi:hypothetical protein